MKKTKKEYEIYLNQLYNETFTLERAEEEFNYMTNKNRGKATNIKTIADAYTNQSLGSLLRKFDPIAFNVGYNDWDG